jgi:hypothetical protein
MAPENKRPAVLIQPIITSPATHIYHQTEVNQSPDNICESKNSTQITRLVNPSARSTSPPRVPARARIHSPRKSQGDFLDMGSVNHAMASDNKNVPMMNAVLHTVTRKEIQYKDFMKISTLGPLYKKDLCYESGRLCRGIRDIQGTNTCFFVQLTNIHKGCKISYGKLVYDYRPNKAEKYWVRLTVDGNTLYYIRDMATSTADITTFKILINSTLSTEDAEMMKMDIINYYLRTPLPRYEYM